MLSFITSVPHTSVQTAGLAGAQAQLRAVCHGEGRQQGHVHQERRGQCAQQKSVGGAAAVGEHLDSAHASVGRTCGFQEGHCRA